MIVTLVVGVLLAVWIIIKRSNPKNKVTTEPLGLPQNSVRAIIALLLVALPIDYLLAGSQVPDIVTNSFFVIVMFYFQNRTKSTQLNIGTVEVPHFYSLYWPKYTVRILLFAMILFFVLYNYFGPQIPFENMNTEINLLFILIFYWFGVVINLIHHPSKKPQLTPNWKDSIMSVIMLVAIIISLVLFGINQDFVMLIGQFSISLREILLLFLNTYFGYRN